MNKKKLKLEKKKRKSKIKQMSLIEKGKILAWRQLKKPLTHKEIALRLKRSRGTISYFLSKVKKTGQLKRKVGTGRKTKTTKKKDCQIVNEFKKNPFITVKKVKNKLNLNLGESTIRRRLRQARFFNYKKRNRL